MNSQQAYIEGFVKRAGEYGYSRNEAMQFLKQATAADAPNPAAIHSKPINITSPTPAPVRQFGMTNAGLGSAQAQMDRGEELTLASR